MTVTKKQRLFVRERAKYHCEYCKRSEQWGTINFEAEHIKPKSKGGSDEYDNLACACRECNQNKSDYESHIDSKTQIKVSLFNPRTEDWFNHFQWTEDGVTIIGKTAIGRATIDCLRMNDPRLCKARLGWHKLGWIPPQE